MFRPTWSRTAVVLTLVGAAAALPASLAPFSPGEPSTGPAALSAPVRAASATTPLRPAAAGPDTVVALGDSAASGEGAGDYQPGTRGELGDWCHRSPHAYIQRTGLAPVVVNLACSGARSADIAFGTGQHYTEPSQAEQLEAVARTHRVTTVVAQLGANDDPGFGGSIARCVAAFLAPPLPGCSVALDAAWPSRLAAMAPKARAALTDVRTAMRDAGYSDGDWTLVVASYPSPVTETMTRTHGLVGCPLRAADARWGRTVAAPALSATLRQVADQVDARFLDLSRATEGHEACTSTGKEWVRRLTVNPRAFATGGLTALGHLAQESFHENSVAHGELATCLAAFVRADDAHGTCVPGPNGHLRLGSGDTAPAGRAALAAPAGTASR